MSKIRFAIIGCGRIARRHAEHINDLGILSAVCDKDLQRAEGLASLYGAKAYTDITNMLESETDLQVVSVCTPNALHAEHSVRALLAGFHVVCEKPMAITVPDCKRMLEASERTGKKLFVIKQNRFNPPVAALKKAIDEGRLGRIFNVQLNCFWNRNDEYYLDSDWKGKQALDGGTLFTQFSHFIDLLYWLVGDVKKAHAYLHNFMHNPTVEFEDTGVVILEFENGAVGSINYTVNSIGRNMEGSVTVFGEKGTVKVGGQYLNELDYQNIQGYEIKDLPPGNPPNNYGFYQGSMSNHNKIYENVIDVLENNGVIKTDGWEGLKTVEIIGKIYASQQKG